MEPILLIFLLGEHVDTLSDILIRLINTISPNRTQFFSNYSTSPRSPMTIRTGSVRASRAKRSTFFLKVALNSIAIKINNIYTTSCVTIFCTDFVFLVARDWLLSGLAVLIKISIASPSFAILIFSPNPMSNIRSASSKTRYVTRVSDVDFPLT